MCHGTMTQPTVEKAFSWNKVAEITCHIRTRFMWLCDDPQRARHIEKTNKQILAARRVWEESYIRISGYS